MSDKKLVLIDRSDDIDREFAKAVIAGLAQAPKVIPARYFYDSRGSELFEEITLQPEYYPTRTEVSLFERYGAAMANALGEGVALIELGSGSSRKTPLLLKYLVRPAAYVPVDIADDFLLASARNLATGFPHLRILPVAADFTRPFALPAEIAGVPHAGFFPGSTIGNFEPRAAAQFLERLTTILGGSARLLIGVDLKKDKAVLERAYNDAAGVTAAFNLNLLERINREFDADFDLAAFRHEARYSADAGRIEMHLTSTKAQAAHVLGRRFEFAAGETIHTENSYKYTLDEFTLMARIAGWRPLQHWIDEEALFSVHLLEVAPKRLTP